MGSKKVSKKIEAIEIQEEIAISRQEQIKIDLKEIEGKLNVRPVSRFRGSLLVNQMELQIELKKLK